MRALMLAVQATVLGLMGALPSAMAQPAATMTMATPLASNPPHDAGGDAGAFSGFRLSAPLRLSLEGAVVPMASAFPNCVSREDDAGNSVGRIPVQHYADFRLTPRLVLSGFTQLGCPIDGGVGGALTYAIPLNASTRVVLGSGIYVAPAQLPLYRGLSPSWAGGLRGASTPVQTAARIDIGWTSQSGRRSSFGFETLGLGRQGIRFGGGF